MKSFNMVLLCGALVCVLLLLCTGSGDAELLKSDNDDDVYRMILQESSVVTLAERLLHTDETNAMRLSEECRDDLKGIIAFREEWAQRMVDSGGKIPHGILRGNLQYIGQHKECVETSVVRPPGDREMAGRHCMLHVKVQASLPLSQKDKDFNRMLLNIDMPNVDLVERFGVRATSPNSLTFKIGICLPTSCAVQDINSELHDISNVLQNAFQKLNPNLTIVEESCSVKRSIELTPGDIATITFLCVIGFFMFCSTGYDVWYQIIKKGDKKDQSKLLVSFSVYTNSQRLFTPSKNPGPLACLHGIRSISFFWIVLGHRYFHVRFMPLENLVDTQDWSMTLESSVIMGMNVVVDTFFVMSGVLLSYNFFKSTKLENIKGDLPMFYIHRILRLTPLLGVVVLLYCTLVSHYANGPNKYDIMDKYVVDPCRNYWWATLLYVQNYVGDQTCVAQTWYLGVDMQLYIVSPLLLYPLLWNKKVGLVWVSLCIAIAQATLFGIAYNNHYNIVDRKDFKNIYVGSHARATPYFIGLLAGYLIYHSFKKNNIKTIQYKFLKGSVLKKFFMMLSLLCCLIVMGAVLFGNHPIYTYAQEKREDTQLEELFFNTFKRTGWGLAILGIILVCAYGYGGPINWFLSLRVWEIFGRFSYAVYLTHLGIQLMLISHTNHVRLFTHMNVVVDYFGDLIMSFIVSYVFILAFDSPVPILEKLIFKRGGSNEKAKKDEIQAVPMPVKLDSTIVIDKMDDKKS